MSETIKLQLNGKEVEFAPTVYITVNRYKDLYLEKMQESAHNRNVVFSVRYKHELYGANADTAQQALDNFLEKVAVINSQLE
jgi:hypothetical protein